MQEDSPVRHSERDFRLLDALDSEEITSQRQLAECSGMSLGKVNFLLKSFLEKGLVKIGNFKKSPHKIGYVYLLTPKGIETKSRLAVRFVISKLKEYNLLRQRLAEKLVLLEASGHKCFVFVGPKIVRECLASLIKDKHLNMYIMCEFESLESLADFDKGKFDAALIFDEKAGDIPAFSEKAGISPDRLIKLW